MMTKTTNMSKAEYFCCRLSHRYSNETNLNCDLDKIIKSLSLKIKTEVDTSPTSPSQDKDIKSTIDNIKGKKLYKVLVQCNRKENRRNTFNKCCCCSNKDAR